MELDYLGRAMALLEAIIADRGQRPLTGIAESIGLPLATAHRLAQSLVEARYIVRSRRGYYHAGPALVRMHPMLDLAAVAAGIARPWLERLARQHDCTAHLGRFEQDMVTYLLKTGEARDHLFTKEAMQQEAYCSGLGKVLLAGLGADRLEAYFAGGPFIRLTPNTIVDENDLRAEIALTRSRGFAIDNGEISENLFCVAVPVRAADGEVFAAISLSFMQASIQSDACNSLIGSLKLAAERIENCLFGQP